MQTHDQRNEDICHDKKSMDVAELARTYGLFSKRIKPILDKKEISHLPRLVGGEAYLQQSP